MKRVQRPSRDKQPPAPAADAKRPRRARPANRTKPPAPSKKALPPAAPSEKPAKAAEAPSVTDERHRAAEPASAEPTTKRARRGLGTLGMGSLQRHLPTITLAVERPRPLSSPVPLSERPMPTLSTENPASTSDLLRLRDGLRELLAFLDAPVPTQHEM
jgi:hypothetical protein